MADALVAQFLAFATHVPDVQAGLSPVVDFDNLVGGVTWNDKKIAD
jgi:hypothetical protein